MPPPPSHQSLTASFFPIHQSNSALGKKQLSPLPLLPHQFFKLIYPGGGREGED